MLCVPTIPPYTPAQASGSDTTIFVTRSVALLSNPRLARSKGESGKEERAVPHSRSVILNGWFALSVLKTALIIRMMQKMAR
jgi:hypothetical protein